MLAESIDGLRGSSLGELCEGAKVERVRRERANEVRSEPRGQTLKEERQEGDEEHEEDRLDASLEPLEDGIEVV